MPRKEEDKIVRVHVKETIPGLSATPTTLVAAQLKAMWRTDQQGIWIENHRSQRFWVPAANIKAVEWKSKEGAD